jgi:hypothetical protein
VTCGFSNRKPALSLECGSKKKLASLFSFKEAIVRYPGIPKKKKKLKHELLSWYALKSEL